MLVSGVVRRTLRHGRAQTQTGRSEAKESRLQRTSILPLRGMPATCCDACGYGDKRSSAVRGGTDGLEDACAPLVSSYH